MKKIATLSSILILSLFYAHSNALASSSPSSPILRNLEVKYFNAKGAAESIRVILALTNTPYKDTRFEIPPGSMESPEFKAAKEAGDLDMNLGRAPILIVNDNQIIGQSRAIERFLAKQLGLMGTNAIEEAQIDCIAEHCRDVKDMAQRKGFSAFTRNKTDEEKAIARKEWFEQDLPTMLQKIETAVQKTSQKSGYSMGSSNSYSDVCIFSLLRDCTMQMDQEETIEAAKDCKLLMSIADRIAKEENVAKWVSERPIGWFDQMGMKKTK